MNSYFELICALMRCIRGGIFPHFSLRIEVQGANRAVFSTQNGQAISPPSFLTGWATLERSEKRLIGLFQNSTPHSVLRRNLIFLAVSSSP